jgi:hypothetical protein
MRTRRQRPARSVPCGVGTGLSVWHLMRGGRPITTGQRRTVTDPHGARRTDTARNRAGLTQAEVAEGTGVTTEVYGAWRGA